MAVVRTLARVFGWLLTPFVAWAASFLGASAVAAVTPLFPSPRTGLIVTGLAAVLAAMAALWAWLRLLRRSPDLRETLQVTAEGSPVGVEETLTGSAPDEEGSDANT